MLLYMAKDVIKLRTLRESPYPELSGWVLNAVISTLIREMLRRKDRQGGSVKIQQREMWSQPGSPGSDQKLEEVRNRAK